MKNDFLSYVCLAIGQIVIGCVVVLSKTALELMPVFIYLAARFLVSATGLTLSFAAGSRKWTLPTHPEGRLTRKDWALMILGGLCAGTLFNHFLLWGLKYTTATSAGIIGSALPAITVVSAVFFLKEKLSFSQLIAVLFAMLGIMLIGLNNPNDLDAIGSPYGSLLGDFLILLSLFPEAWYSIINKFLSKRVTPLASAVVANIFTFITFIPFALYESRQFDWSTITPFSALIVVLAGLCSLLFYWLWPLGLRRISASTASLFGGLMPVSSCLLAIWFLGEKFHMYEGMGMILIFVSIWVGSVAPTRKEGSEILEH